MDITKPVIITCSSLIIVAIILCAFDHYHHKYEIAKIQAIGDEVRKTAKELSPAVSKILKESYESMF